MLCCNGTPRGEGTFIKKPITQVYINKTNVNIFHQSLRIILLIFLQYYQEAAINRQCNLRRKIRGMCCNKRKSYIKFKQLSGKAPAFLKSHKVLAPTFENIRHYWHSLTLRLYILLLKNNLLKHINLEHRF